MQTGFLSGRDRDGRAAAPREVGGGVRLARAQTLGEAPHPRSALVRRGHLDTLALERGHLLMRAIPELAAPCVLRQTRPLRLE